MTTTIYINVIGSGTVLSTDYRNDPFEGTAFARDYPAGGIANLTAKPAAGWKIDHWIIDDIEKPGTTTIDINMDVNHTAIAVFSTKQINFSLSSAVAILIAIALALASGVAVLVGKNKKKEK